MLSKIRESFSDSEWWCWLLAPPIMIIYLLILPYHFAFYEIPENAKVPTALVFGISSISFTALKVYAIYNSIDEGFWFCLLIIVCLLFLGLIAEGLVAAVYAFLLEVTGGIGQKHPYLQAVVCLFALGAIAILAYSKVSYD